MLEQCDGNWQGSRLLSWSPPPLYFFSFPSATWPNGFVLFFFPGVGRVKEHHKTGLGLPGDNGLYSKIMRRENWWFEQDKRNEKRVWSKLWFEHDIKYITISIFILWGEKIDGLSGIKEKRKEFGPNCGLSTILNSWRFLFSFYDVSKICHRNWAQTRAHTGYLQIYDENSYIA